MRKFIATSLLCAGLMTAPSAYAATFLATDAGKTINVTFTGQAGGAPAPALSSFLELTFLGTSDGGLSYDFSYTLTNDSSVSARLRGLGFNVDAMVSGLDGVTGTLSDWQLDSMFPEGVGTLDVCLYSGGNCTGGSGGINTGDSDMGTFSLIFDDIYDGITLSDFHTRYQSIDPAVNGATSGVGIGEETPAVPEPSTWALLLLGFAAVGYSLRAKQSKVRVSYS